MNKNSAIKKRYYKSLDVIAILEILNDFNL
jgi:hypothetical protein